MPSAASSASVCCDQQSVDAGAGGDETALSPLSRQTALAHWRESTLATLTIPDCSGALARDMSQGTAAGGRAVGQLLAFEELLAAH